MDRGTDADGAAARAGSRGCASGGCSGGWSCGRFAAAAFDAAVNESGEPGAVDFRANCAVHRDAVDPIDAAGIHDHEAGDHEAGDGEPACYGSAASIAVSASGGSEGCAAGV